MTLPVDAYLFDYNLRALGNLERDLEGNGFGGCWFAETKHNPFLACAIAAVGTSRPIIGTNVAVAFPRSPMVVAQVAWDLAQASEGRFWLGLGSQVRQHIERRFSAEFGEPVARLRDYVLAVRAIHAAFAQGTGIKYEGRYYQHTLLTEFFRPSSEPSTFVPILVAGVNVGMAELAGEVADGFQIHPLHSRQYLQEVLMSAIDKGLDASRRSRQDLSLVCPVFIIAGGDEAELRERTEFVRRQIAFYGSTPTYRSVFDLHGWGNVAEGLRAAIRRGDDASELIDDEILETFAVRAPWHRVAEELSTRYEGVVDRIVPYEDAASWTPADWQRWGDIARDLAN